MKQLSFLLVFVTIILFPNLAHGQSRDSILSVTSLSQDSFYIITENIPKHKAWGNSWYIGGAFSISKSLEFHLNFGRTYGKRYNTPGEFGINMKSWGLGYSRFKRGDRIGHTVNAFGEISNFFLPPGTVRLDYIYDISYQKHYIRPSIGLNFNNLDLLYHYSIKIVGEQNDFKHGFTFRIKFYVKSKNWQHSYIRWLDR